MHSNDLNTFIKNKGYHLEEEVEMSCFGPRTSLEVAREWRLNTEKKWRPPRVLHAPPLWRLGCCRAAPKDFKAFWVCLASACSKPTVGGGCSVKAEKQERKRKEEDAREEREGGKRRGGKIEGMEPRVQFPLVFFFQTFQNCTFTLIVLKISKQPQRSNFIPL